MAQRLLAWSSFFIVLVLVPVAAAAQTVVSAKAQITGSGTSYRLTVMNDAMAILCFGLLLTGVQPTSASGPPVCCTRVGTFQGRRCWFTCAGQPQRRAVVQPGGTVTADFRTNIAIPTDVGARDSVLGHGCLAGSDQIGQASGPPRPPPKPKPQPNEVCVQGLEDEDPPQPHEHREE